VTPCFSTQARALALSEANGPPCLCPCCGCWAEELAEGEEPDELPHAPSATVAAASTATVAARERLGVVWK
jgi:hypothetical protein